MDSPKTVIPPSDATEEQDGTRAEVQKPTPPSIATTSSDQTTKAGENHPLLPQYTYEKTSILLVAHFRPQKDDGSPREIWLSVQNGVGNEQDCPIYRLLTEADLGGEWPGAVAALLSDLANDLPARQRKFETRQARSAPAPNVQPSTTTSTSKSGKVSSKTVAVSPPPVPAGSMPPPVHGLVMKGLFDGLQDETPAGAELPSNERISTHGNINH